MKTASNLKADFTEGPFWPVINSGPTINFMRPKGFLIHVQLSNLGVTIRRQDKAVAIPMDELVKLAQENEPALVPPEPPKPEANNSEVKKVS